MAAGRPVVGTSVGLEGLDVDDGVHALVADEGPALADAVVRLLTDDELAARVAGAGADHARGHYAWDAIGRHFVDVLLGLVQRQAR
jgi:glycosyltransferase involved in cell wall biosynthesis